MSAILATSRKAARVRMLGGTHARRYDHHRDFAGWLLINHLPKPRHRKEGTS